MAETRTFIFRSRPEAVSAARRALDGFDELLDAGAFYDASLCVSELVTNAVLHSDIGPDDELRLDVSVIDGARLRVSVGDAGPGFSPVRPGTGDESGWGLYIVDRLSHSWGVEHENGTRVWFEMLTSRHDAAAAAADAARDGAPDERRAADAEPGRRAVGRMRLRPQTTA